MLSSPQPQPPVAATARQGLVPYIASWSSERFLPCELVVRGGRLGYADETALDRDRHGVLWTRMSVSPGRGRPDFGRVHLLRQRRAMNRRLCQVCAAPCDESALWLLSTREYEDDPWPAPISTGHPPVCPGCARRSVAACPHLRGGYVAVRARRAVIGGVFGTLYRPGRSTIEQDEAVAVEYDDPRTRWMRAAQILMRLDDYTVVSLDPG
ncbi:hypothetical protein [Actinomadura atramentaria]|uniref:hypothetical protein n=1 Tax=Actinomadura atramentaria TaxID=1990 RepID=UPI00036A2EED|nr:hypothetical protein [Actinomadura atramentaria]